MIRSIEASIRSNDVPCCIVISFEPGRLFQLHPTVPGLQHSSNMLAAHLQSSTHLESPQDVFNTSPQHLHCVFQFCPTDLVNTLSTRRQIFQHVFNTCSTCLQFIFNMSWTHCPYIFHTSLTNLEYVSTTRLEHIFNASPQFFQCAFLGWRARRMCCGHRSPRTRSTRGLRRLASLWRV